MYIGHCILDIIFLTDIIVFVKEGLYGCNLLQTQGMGYVHIWDVTVVLSLQCGTYTIGQVLIACSNLYFPKLQSTGYHTGIIAYVNWLQTWGKTCNGFS